MQQAELACDEEADVNTMLPLIEQMYRLAKGKEGNNVMLSRAMLWDVWANSQKNKDYYLSMIEKAVGIMDTVKYAYDYHRLMMIKQTILTRRGEYLASYILGSKQAAYFDEIGDRIHWAYCMGNISNIFADLSEFEEAIGYAEKAGTVFEEYGMKGKMLLLRLNIALIYNKSGKKEKSCHILKPVVEHFPREANQKIRILYLMSYCNHLEDLKEAESYVEQTYQAALNYPDPYYIQIATLNKASLFRLKGEPDSARVYLHEVQHYLEKELNPVVRERTYDLTSQLFAEQNRYDSAYYYRVLQQRYQDSLQGRNVLLDVHRIKVKKDINNYRLQLEQSRLKAQAQRRFVIAILIAFVVILMLCGIIFRLLFKRVIIEKRLRDVESKEYNERIRNEQLIIDSQNRELSSNTIMLTKKNLVLKDLLEQVTELENEGKLDLKTGKSLRSSIEVTLREDDEWEYFKMHFEQVHPDFFCKLKDAFPDLTDNELRLCAYARLNLSIKQIAQMLSVQPKTIVQARYRMRKKINLDSEELLNDYLRSF